MGRHQPALLGGLLIGILSSLPILNIANCCCLWVIVGGLVTVYLQQQRQPEPIETSEAVLGGLLAGIIGAIIVCAVMYLKFAIVGSMMPPQTIDNVRQQLENNPQVPPQVRDMIMNFMTGRGMGIGLLFGVVAVPLYAIFGMLGALIGTALFRKKTPPVVQG